jgi:putative SOS response-associated peptidase YedK
MCNHYEGHPDFIPTWAEFIGYRAPAEMFNDAKLDIWPRRKAPVAINREGERALEMLQWGVPRTMAGKRPGTTVTKRVTNVRNLTSPFWRSMLSSPAQRCLVPFSRFAEPKPNAGREEVWFAVNDAPVSAFAGIWRTSTEGDVFAFLTCEPNPLVIEVHPKAMPVILQPDDYEDWMAGAPAEELAHPFPSQLMQIVS